jgi:hypothetical protein
MVGQCLHRRGRMKYWLDLEAHGRERTVVVE